MSKHRGVLVGAGGFGGVWAGQFLPRFRDRVDIVGVADVNVQALQRAAESLGVPAAAQYQSVERMFADTRPDVCFVVIPPSARVDAIRLAAQYGVAVFCEKPMAASWSQALEIADLVRQSGLTFAVVQNYREANRIRALKRVLGRAELGAINTLQCRFAVNYTIETAGGAFRHQFPDAMIYEGAEHHIDQFRNLLDADAEWVQGAQWNQPWSTFPANTCVSLLVRMSNGAMVQYEMNHIDRGHQNGWHSEYYRVACEGSTVVLDSDHVVRLTRSAPGQPEDVEEILPDQDPLDGHFAVIGQFLDWLDGGPAPVTVIDDNLRTLALTFCAVEATRTGNRVSVPALLESAGPIGRPTGQPVHAGDREADNLA